MKDKKKILGTIYRAYSTWVEPFPFACQKGCAACCTQSVTMTSLEGELVLDYVEKGRRQKWLADLLKKSSPGKSSALITTNQYASACLSCREVDEEVFGGWDFNPCIFLQENTCSIYEARPFGCRSFGSLKRCSPESAAQMLPIHLTVNTALTQAIEHLSSDGGYWGSLADILKCLVKKGPLDQKMYLPAAQPVPGFLLEMHEVKVVRELFAGIDKQCPDTLFFSDLIDNFLPI